MRKLRTVLCDDWHAGFEAVLRIEMHSYGDEEPPRAEIAAVPPGGRVDILLLTAISLSFSILPSQ